MASQFEETLRRAREKGEAKLKIIAPKYTPKPGTSYGRPSKGRSRGRSSSSRQGAETAKKAAAEAAKREAAEAAKIKAAELKRIEDAKSFAEKTRIAREIVMSRKAQSEFQRMLQFRSNLIKLGATEDKKSATNQAGEKLVVSQWRLKNGDRVERIKNLDKGTTTYSTFEKGRGRYVRKTGGVSMGSIPTVKDFTAGVKITTSSDQNKLIVVLPNGMKGTINAKGRVVIGKRLGGKQYIFQDGVLRKVDGVDIYEEKLKPTEPKELGTKLQRAKEWSARLDSQYSNVKSRLQKSRDDGELERVRELQTLGGDRTAQQTIELKKLEKRTAENYKAGGDLVRLFLTNMVVRMGIGSVEVVRLVKEDPQAFFLALPGNLFDAAKADTKTFTSGDPLAISELLTEYYTGARVIRLAGKGFAVPVGIGKTLSPKYFSKIGTNILTPPITLRGVASKTAAGRKAQALISAELKKRGVTAKVDAFIKKAKKFKGSGDVKIRKIKTITTMAIKNLESRTNLNKQYDRAKKNFKMSMEKRKTVTVGNDDYVKAVVFIEGLSSNIAKIKSQNFLKNYKAKGGKIDKRREGEFIEAVQNDAGKKLNSLPEFKELKNTARLKKSFQINLRKRGKIETAKMTFKKLKVKVNNFPLVKGMKSAIRKVAVKGKAVKRAVKKGVKKIGLVSDKVISNLESRTNLNKQYDRARRNFKESMQKRTAIKVGNDDYVKAVVFIEGLTATVSKISANNYLKQFKAKGGKIDKRREIEFVNAVQNSANKNLNSMSSFKELKNTARLKKPFQIELKKRGKIKTAKIMFKNIKNRIKSTSSVKKMSSIINRISEGVVKVRRGVSPKRIKAKIKKRMDVRKQRKFVKQTIRYQMEKARPIRKVSLDKLKRSQKVSDMNNFIDNFFNELNRRQKINLTPLKFSQMKNVLKKRMRNAINKGNLQEINNFRIAVGKMVTEMNKKSSYPNVKVVESVGKTKRIRTIKDFESPSPKGTFVEVKSGGQVLLQRVEAKTIQKPRQVVRQRLKIVSVQKKAISLRPLLDFGVKSLGAVAVKNTLIGKQTFGIASNQAQLSKVLQDSAQDLKVLQSVGQGMDVNVGSSVMSAVRSNTRVRSMLKTRQVSKKKKKPVVRLKKEKADTRKLSKPVMGYGFVVKVRGKNVRLKIPPMTLRDAWDVGAFKLDHKLQQTGRLINIGMVDVVAKLPKSVAGYYKKNSKKFRRARIKKGKVLTLQRTIIEKRKYISDTPSEKRALKIARKRAKQKPTKRNNRKPTKRVMASKKLPTINNLKSKKKELLLKRKRMINKLKKK